MQVSCHGQQTSLDSRGCFDALKTVTILKCTLVGLQQMNKLLIEKLIDYALEGIHVTHSLSQLQTSSSSPMRLLLSGIERNFGP